MWYAVRMDEVITYVYISAETAFVLFLIALAYYSQRRAQVWHFNLFLTFGLLFAYEYEVAREMIRLMGFATILIGPYREYYLRALDIATGLFIREVILYAEREISSVPTGHHC